MIGTVTESKLSPSGKSYILKIGGATYFGKLDSKLNEAVGKQIDFLFDPSNYGGKTTNWIKSWIYSNEATPTQAPEPVAPSSKPTATPERVIDRWWLPFVSNQTAHLIGAGVIKDKASLNMWMRDLRQAVIALDSLSDDPNF